MLRIKRGSEPDLNSGSGWHHDADRSCKDGRNTTRVSSTMITNLKGHKPYVSSMRITGSLTRRFRGLHIVRTSDFGTRSSILSGYRNDKESLAHLLQPANAVLSKLLQRRKTSSVLTSETLLHRSAFSWLAPALRGTGVQIHRSRGRQKVCCVQRSRCGVSFLRWCSAGFRTDGRWLWGRRSAEFCH